MRLLLGFKVAVFTVCVPGAVLFYVPFKLVLKNAAPIHYPNSALAILGMALMLLGAAVYFRCAWDFAVVGLGTPAPLDPPKRLVVSGFYRWTRNPMFLGVILILVAEALCFPSRELSIYIGCVALIFHLFVVFHEEPSLNAKFPYSYAAYCRAVPRWGIALRPFSQETT